MSELKIDNPAQRLLDILTKADGISSADYTRDVWKKLLGIPNADDQVLISRLIRVMALPGRISQVLDDYFPDMRYQATHWKIQTEKAFFSMELNGRWSNFYTHIDAHTLSELRLLSSMFEIRGEHAAISTQEISELLTRTMELRDEIRTSELPRTLKTLLLKQIAQLQEALEAYSISGVEPVMDAVQSTLGLAVINPEYRNEIGKGAGSMFGEKISDLLSDVANVVTVAGALPALTATVSTALKFLGH